MPKNICEINNSGLSRCPLKTAQMSWKETAGWIPIDASEVSARAQLVLVFGGRAPNIVSRAIQQLHARFPDAAILGCSTAGEIQDIHVTDEGIVATAIEFVSTRVRSATIELRAGESQRVGEQLAQLLNAPDLRHIFVLSDGLLVNGSDLTHGIVSSVGKEVTVSGGLAGDGSRFKETFVYTNNGAKGGIVSAVGLYGSAIRARCASLGGWDSFGPERIVTKSKGNVVFELDGRSALNLYREYLGEHATGLPATGLLFPLSVRGRSDDSGLVRTILGINEDEQSITFAGDVPEGQYARLMKANFDRLIDGAIDAAKLVTDIAEFHSCDLGILISCVGRKMVLGQRVEEEVEGVRDVLGSKPMLTGFYSYGEISPLTPTAKCELHNQTMTITALKEVVD